MLLLDEDFFVCLSVALCVFVSKFLSGQLFGWGLFCILTFLLFSTTASLAVVFYSISV